jgi:hypothetical protein
MGMVWDLGERGTAVGPSTPVQADGALVAVVRALWSDVDGVRVSIDWQGPTDDMSGAQARALANALRQAADLEPPNGAAPADEDGAYGTNGWR